MGLVQQYTRGARRKPFLDAYGPRATNWHIAQIVFVVEANLQAIVFHVASMDYEIVVSYQASPQFHRHILLTFGKCGQPLRMGCRRDGTASR
jgi:hypothetical protein